MTEQELDKLLAKTKLSLGIYDDGSDSTIRQKIMEAISFLELNGISEEVLLGNEAGTTAIVILTADTWKTGGEYKLSPAIEWYISRLYSETRLEAK